MDQYLSFALLCFTSFLTLLNPLGVMPIFLSMTTSFSKQERTKTAKKATIVAAFTIVAFAFSGQVLFKFFGISVDSFRIVGGIIFFMMGYDMLQARLVSMKMDNEETRKNYASDISITPLAIPMISGPGSITNAIILMEDSDNTIKKIILIASIFLVCFIVFLVLWSGNKITKVLGDTGNKIMMRLMGLIVMVIAVEFFFSGLKPILLNILSSI